MGITGVIGTCEKSMSPSIASVINGCTTERLSCGVLEHGTLTTVSVPQGMAWPLPSGPVGLMVFYGAGRLCGRWGTRELVEDDVLVCRPGRSSSVRGTESEDLLLYVWSWPASVSWRAEHVSGCGDATIGSARWDRVEPSTGPTAGRPAAGSLVLDGALEAVSIAGRAVRAAPGDVVHVVGPDVDVSAVSGSRGEAAVVGPWLAPGGGAPVIVRRPISVPVPVAVVGEAVVS